MKNPKPSTVDAALEAHAARGSGAAPLLVPGPASATQSGASQSLADAMWLRNAALESCTAWAEIARRLAKWMETYRYRPRHSAACCIKDGKILKNEDGDAYPGNCQCVSYEKEYFAALAAFDEINAGSAEQAGDRQPTADGAPDPSPAGTNAELSGTPRDKSTSTP